MQSSRVLCVCPQILEGMPITDEVEQLLQVMGPFYELVDEKKKISQVSDLTTGTVTNLPRLRCRHKLCNIFHMLTSMTNSLTSIAISPLFYA